MFVTNVLFKKAKSKLIMVLMESVVSGHQVTMIRERLADKLEFIRFDPYKILFMQYELTVSLGLAVLGLDLVLIESIMGIQAAFNTRVCTEKGRRLGA